MNKTTVIGVAGGLLLAAVLVLGWRATRISPAVTGAASPAGRKSAPPPGPAPAEMPAETILAPPVRAPERPVAGALSSSLTAVEKAVRVAKIKRDYEEIRIKASADYSAAGAAFPGGLHAFLRQLALLEREKRADLAVVLTPRELEDIEMSESTAGQLVERLLAPTRATVEQRRMVFQLQRAFEDRFALTFDLTPRALFEREAARQQTQEQIRTVLGDDLFGSWLFGEGEDYALGVAFAARHRLPESATLDLWRTKNEYTLRRLELGAQKGSSPEARRAAQAVLLQQTESRVMAIVGPGLLQGARSDVLSWLPKR